jgi:ABC-2 type transport system permease protein
VEKLPEPFRTFSHFNPIFYLIDGFRYGFIGRPRAMSRSAWR